MRLCLLVAVLWLESVLCFLGPACKRSTALGGLVLARRQLKPAAKTQRWLDACTSYTSAPSVRAQASVPPKPPPGPSFCLEPEQGTDRPRNRPTFQALLNRELVEREKNPEAILSLVQEHVEDMNAVNCATALHRLSRVPTPSLTSDPRFHLLLSRTEETLSSSNPQAMSNVLHALAHLQHHPGSAFLTTLLDHALRQLAAFTPQALSLTITSLATFRHAPSPLFLTRFYGAVLSHLHTFTAQGLSTLLHSLATMPLPSPPPPSFLHPALTHYSSVLLRSSSPTSLSLFAASLPTLDPSHPNATTALLVASLPLLPSFQPQDCVLLLQGLSKLTTAPPSHLLAPLLSHIQSQLPTFPPVALPILLLCLTRMRTPLPPPLLHELPTTLLHHHRALSPRGLITCLYSLYRQGCTPKQPLLESSLAHLQPRVKELDLQDASHLLLVLAAGRDKGSVSRQRASAFLTELLGPLEPLLAGGSALDLSTIISSLAKLGHHPGQPFLDRMLSAATTQLARHRTPPCALAKLLYGLSRFSSSDSPLKGAFADALYHGLDALRREKVQLSGQDVSQILVALGRMHARPQAELLGWLTSEADARRASRALNHQDLAAIMQGMGLLLSDGGGVPDPALLTRLLCEVHRQSSCFSVREAINVVVGGASLLRAGESGWREDATALLKPIVGRIEQNLSHVKAAEASDVADSLQALGYSDEARRIAEQFRGQQGGGKRPRGPPGATRKGRQR